MGIVAGRASREQGRAGIRGPAQAGSREGALSALPACGVREGGESAVKGWWGQGWATDWTLAKPLSPSRRKAAPLLPAPAKVGRSAGSFLEFPRPCHSPGAARSQKARLCCFLPSSSSGHTHRILPVLPVVGVGTQRGRHFESVGGAAVASEQ